MKKYRKRALRGCALKTLTLPVSRVWLTGLTHLLTRTRESRTGRSSEIQIQRAARPSLPSLLILTHMFSGISQ